MLREIGVWALGMACAGPRIRSFHSRSAFTGHARACVNRFVFRPSWLMPVLLSARALRPVSAQSAPPTRTLYLVRHGFCDYQDRDDKTGNGLLPLGREQATLVADRLAKFPIRSTSITSSEFTRARETGDIIAARLGQTCSRDGLLNECTPTPMPNLPKLGSIIPARQPARPATSCWSATGTLFAGLSAAPSGLTQAVEVNRN